MSDESTVSLTTGSRRSDGLEASIALAVRRWWYGALIPEWPPFVISEHVLLARYVSPKASQWVPLVTDRYELEKTKKDLAPQILALTAKISELRGRYIEEPTEELARDIDEANDQIEGYQTTLRDLRRKIVATIYDKLKAMTPPIRYVIDPFSPNPRQQTIRTPGEIIESLRQGTCFDLSALFCGLCLSQKLLPFMVMLDGHALAAVSLNEDFESWDSPDRWGREALDRDQLKDAEGRDTLLEWVKAGRYLAVECTGFAYNDEPSPTDRVDGLLPFEKATNVYGERALSGTPKFQYALDVATAQVGSGIEPCEPRKVYGERRFEQSRRQLRLVFAGSVALTVLLALWFVAVFSRAKDVEERFLTQIDPAHFRSQAVGGPVAWVALSRLKSRLADDLGPEATNVRTSEHADWRSRAALAVFALSGGRDKSSLFEVLGGFTASYHPQARAYTIARLPFQGLTTAKLAGWLDRDDVVRSDRLRQALVLAIARSTGEPTSEALSKLLTLFQSDRDPGVHSAAEWAIRIRWPLEGRKPLADLTKTLRDNGINRLKSEKLDPKQRQWFVDKPSGLTMVYFPPGVRYEIGDLSRASTDQPTALMGQYPSTIPTRVPVIISEGFDAKVPSKGFAIATVETPKAVYKHVTDPTVFERGTCLNSVPVSWVEAARFCFDSTPEGVGKSYRTIEDKTKLIHFINVDLNTDKPFPDASYRLPDDAEWEYAARGGSLDLFCFGVDPRLLGRYGYVFNSGGPSGKKMPNDFGLFDVHGGLSEWCNDRDRLRDPDEYRLESPLASGQPLAGERPIENEDQTFRICRGGSQGSRGAEELTVFYRGRMDQKLKTSSLTGFRIAMTVSPAHFADPTLPSFPFSPNTPSERR
jgi:hypothetical protein